VERSRPSHAYAIRLVLMGGLPGGLPAGPCARADRRSQAPSISWPVWCSGRSATERVPRGEPPPRPALSRLISDSGHWAARPICFVAPSAASSPYREYALTGRSSGAWWSTGGKSVVNSRWSMRLEHGSDHCFLQERSDRASPRRGDSTCPPDSGSQTGNRVVGGNCGRTCATRAVSVRRSDASGLNFRGRAAMTREAPGGQSGGRSRG